jgi:predicted TIM-barrel fold metal-dependent hydrolase
MTDNHVHIGQFKDIYYDPLEIVDTVMSAGMEGMSFSSTSSCKENIQYQEIEKEIAVFLSRISFSAETIRPFFWCVPDYINQNLTIEKVFGSIPYKGIKIHPFSHNWDFNNIQHMDFLHGLFNYASDNNLPILIHTGHSGIDSANRFERFIAEYNSVLCILAHCRPLDITIDMLKKYNNVYGDTAFTTEEAIQKIIRAGLGEKIILGSDFPITHYYRTKPNISLQEEYAEDIAGWKKLKTLL